MLVGGFTFAMQVPALMLPTDTDYLLFSVDGVIAEGRFDTAWDLLKDAESAQRASGVVTLDR